MSTHGSATLSLTDLRGNLRRLRRERLIRRLFFAAAVLSILVSLLIVASLAGGAIDFLSKLDGIGQLWNPRGWFPRRGLFDILTIFLGTALVAGVAIMVAAPIGLGAAMYLSEYAGRRRRFLKPIIEILAGVPSVVMGFFALTFISPNLVQKVVPGTPAFSIAAAGIGVGILIIPLVATIAEDSMHAVPGSLREAAFGLGAKRRAVSVRVVFPAAISGIVAALILGVSRAIGETLVVTIAAGAVGGSARTIDIFGPGQTMTAAMTSLATGSDQVRGVGPAFPSLFFVGLLLFAMTLGLNLISERFVRRVRRRY